MLVMQILNQLYADKRIKLKFENEDQREQFRIRLYKAKKQQDDAMSAVLDETRMVLRAKKIDVEIEFGIDYHLELWMEEKKKPGFTIVSIEDREDNDAAGSRGDANSAKTDSDVRESLAKADGKPEQGSKN